jgi:histidinol dehydrogenase
MEFPTFKWQQLSADARRAALQRPSVVSNDVIQTETRNIIDRIKQQGDCALRELSLRFDGVSLDRFEVSNREFDEAERNVSETASDAINLAIQNVARFHQAQKPLPIDIETMPGVRCQRISQPIDSVGMYVPAGSAPLPSAAIMQTVPAKIAACPQRILCTPPRTDGSADPTVLVAARRGGANRIFKVGGAQAIAAMAYGTESIPKVNKIFGPGNAWVTAAKTIVAADAAGAAIDMPAGPSEVMIIADSSANAEFVAADLLSQAEHGDDSQVVLLSSSGDLINNVKRQLKEQVKRLSRAKIICRSLQNSRLIQVSSIDVAVAICNEYAPEHLLLHIQEPRAALRFIRNAGSVFLGPWTPESVGDYCSGTNHVLPTNGAARAFSGLGLDQFLRQTTVQELTRDGLQSLSNTVIELAMLECLDAHANAVSRRLTAIDQKVKAS